MLTFLSPLIYNFNRGIDMLFLASNMYCKYVIALLCSRKRKLVSKNENCDMLDDKLYESYLELEKLLHAEFH